MNDPIQDTFSNSTVFVFCTITVDSIVPFVGVILRTEDQSSFLAAGFNDLQQVVCFSFRKRSEEPFINDQQVIFRVRRFELMLSIDSFGNSKLIQKIRQPYIP